MARFAQVTEALSHPRSQIGLVEVRKPGRIILAGHTIKCPLHLGEDRAAGVRVVPDGMPVRFHDQTFRQQGRRAVADGRRLRGPGQIDGLASASQIQCLMCLCGKDFRGETRIGGVPRIRQCLGEIPLGEAVFVIVVGNPAGQLGQLTTSCGELPAGLFPVGAGREQA